MVTKVTWGEIDIFIKRLEKKLDPIRYQIKNVYGITDGGLIIATMLSYKLDVPLIRVKSQIGRFTLIAEDYIHSGHGLENLLKTKKPLVTASIFYNKISTVIPNIHLITTEDNPQMPWI